MTFSSTVQLAKKTATGIPVPDEVVEALGAGRRPAVHVTVGGYTYRSTVASRGDGYKIPLSAEHREAAGLAAGDTVDVTLALDTEPREVALPPELAAALAGDPEARAFYDGLAPSRKQALVLPVEGAKTPQTRERRVAKAVALIGERRVR